MKALSWSIALVLASSAYAQNQDSNERFTVKTELISQIVELDGVVQLNNQGSLAAQTSGRVVGLYVDVNDFVKRSGAFGDLGGSAICRIGCRASSIGECHGTKP